ncbi:hypothetical protein BSNK01_02510 [Bacillaceae bacterium]
MNVVRKLSDVVYAVERAVAMILLIVMLVSIVAGVIFRYFLDAPLSWSDELAIFSLVWVTFIGGSMSIKRQQAAAVTFLMERLSGTARRVLLAIGGFSVVAFCLYAFYLAATWLSSPSIWFEKSDAMFIPMFYPYLCIPLGLLGMFIHSVDQLLHILFRTDGEGA